MDIPAVAETVVRLYRDHPSWTVLVDGIVEQAPPGAAEVEAFLADAMSSPRPLFSVDRRLFVHNGVVEFFDGPFDSVVAA